MQICSKCGAAFDNYPCRVCVAREASIEKVFGPCLIVAAAGLCGASLATFLFPPLAPPWLAICAWPAIVLLPVPIGFVFVNWRRLPRYAGPFRLVLFSISAMFVILGPYYLLNGLLDSKPPVAAQAIVSGKGRTCCSVECTVSMNGKKIVHVSTVNPETFYDLQLDEAAYVAVHPGAFSLPWFRGRDVRSRDSHAGDSR